VRAAEFPSCCCFRGYDRASDARGKAQMSGRILSFPALIGAVCFVVAPLAACRFAGAQPSVGDDGWTPPRTAWGDPDLRGTWPIWHLIGTPLERPPEIGERRALTDEEFELVQQRVAERNARYDDEIDSNTMGGGHWAEPTTALRISSLIVDPPSGRLPELTDEGRRRAAEFGSSWSTSVFDSVADFDPWDRCITRGLPVSMLPRNYNNGVQIFQSPGFVVIRLEMVDRRVIPVDDRPPPADALRQWMGESRGHWEDDTLVVETTNFNGAFSLTNLGVPGSPREPHPSSERLRIVERLTRTGEETIEYEITVDDPVTMTAPFTIAYPMQRDDSYRLFEYACHEGNTAVRNYIETSRYEREHATDDEP
jgi:hypothetical protein